MSILRMSKLSFIARSGEYHLPSIDGSVGNTINVLKDIIELAGLNKKVRYYFGDERYSIDYRNLCTFDVDVYRDHILIVMRLKTGDRKTRRCAFFINEGVIKPNTGNQSTWIDVKGYEAPKTIVSDINTIKRFKDRSMFQVDDILFEPSRRLITHYFGSSADLALYSHLAMMIKRFDLTSVFSPELNVIGKMNTPIMSRFLGMDVQMVFQSYKTGLIMNMDEGLQLTIDNATGINCFYVKIAAKPDSTLAVIDRIDFKVKRKWYNPFK